MSIFQKISDFIYLIGLNFVVKVRNVKEFFTITFRYYQNWSFMKVDLTLLFAYFFRSPFAISKQFLKEQGVEDLYAYGETPLSTFDEIVKRCQISFTDVVFELGCGRGRTCFWLHALIGCKVIGIEQVGTFVKKATSIVKRFNLKEIEFRQEDILDADLHSATVLYIYGTCFDDLFINQLIKKIKALPSGIKIITTSYALNDYSSQKEFEIFRRFPAKFTWGIADVYLQIKK